MPKQKQNWYQMNRKDVLSALNSRAGGLTSEEAEERLQKYGKNELPSKSAVSPFKLFLNQVKSPLVYVLLIAAGISFFVGEAIDVVVILSAVLVNSAIGFWQEYKADKAMHHLQSLIQYNVTVIRDGKEQRIDAKLVVPGDIILLESGDKISADARLLEENSLRINEASLTGESFVVDKSVEALEEERSVGDRVNMVHLGTAVAGGRGKAIVVATGLATEIGRIASLVEETRDEKTPLQQQIVKVSHLLTIVVVIAALLVFLIGLTKDFAVEELLLTSAALAVAAIPEGLLVSMTLVLVVGMKRILKRDALIRRLIAAETLGSVSIICSDKTGTITKGEMIVDQLMIGGETHPIERAVNDLSGGQEKHHLLAIKAMALCNNAFIKNPRAKLHDWEIEGDETDGALLKAATQAGFDKEELSHEYGRVDEIPFNEVYKYQATLHYIDDGNRLFAKGAPEMILSMCDSLFKNGRTLKMTDARYEETKREYEELTKQGLRVLGLATKRFKKKELSFNDLIDDREDPELDGLTFIGWVGLKDPVRDEVPKAFQTVKGAGIRTVIVTGDHKFTVQAIVKELGLDVPEERIMIGTELEELSDEELTARIREIDIFARVEPKHKVRIVEAWKKQGEVVAMLGDGVNDAPALKSADIGVAVGDATDVAKEIAEMILLKGDFTVIEAAVREGRVMFDNIRKIFLYLISDSFTEILLISIAMLIGYPIPLTAVQILWINIVSDGFPGLSLTLEPAERDVMKLKPRKKNERIVNKEIFFMIFLITVLAVTAAMAVYAYYLRHFDLIYARTMIFAAFTIDSLIYVMGVRTLRQPIWKTNLFSNPWLLVAIAVSAGLTILFIQTPWLGRFLDTVPLRLNDWLLVFGIAMVTLTAREMVKWFYWHKKGQALRGE